MPQANTLGRRGFNLTGGGDACNFQGKPLRLCILCILAPSLFSFIASINLSSREDHETLSHIGVCTMAFTCIFPCVIRTLKNSAD